MVGMGIPKEGGVGGAHLLPVPRRGRGSRDVGVFREQAPAFQAS